MAALDSIIIAELFLHRHKNTGATILDDVKDVLKVIGLAVERIRYILADGLAAILREVEKLVVESWWAAQAQRQQVALVHRKNQIKALKVLRLQQPCCETGEVIAPSHRVFLRMKIDRFSRAEVMGGGRSHMHPIVQALVDRLLAQDLLSRWTAAQVVSADEEY